MEEPPEGFLSAAHLLAPAPTTATTAASLLSPPAPPASHLEDAPRPAEGVLESMVSAAGYEATNAKTKTNKREKMSHLWVFFDFGTKDYTKTSKEVFCIVCKDKNVKVSINGRLDAMATHLAKRVRARAQRGQGGGGARRRGDP